VPHSSTIGAEISGDKPQKKKKKETVCIFRSVKERQARKVRSRLMPQLTLQTFNLHLESKSYSLSLSLSGQWIILTVEPAKIYSKTGLYQMNNY
jgi:hypothetical protein